MPCASGTMMPEAVTVATVAEPVARRMSMATSQPAMSGFIADSLMPLAMTSPMSESMRVCLKPPPAATMNTMPAAAAASARNASMEARAMFPVMAGELRRHGEAGDLESFHDLDVRFHSSILANSGNDLFASMADIIGIVLRGRVELHMYPQKPKPAALDAHDAVAEAIWKGDPDRARASMHDIVDEVAESLELT